MKILVTGHSGFIGKYLIKELSKTKNELLLFDISDGTDICDWEQVKHIEGIDIIIHLANLSFVPASYSDPKRFYQVNYLGTLNMLELCRINKAEMIYFSSYLYGTPQYQPIDENHPLSAYNPYAQTKLIAESLCEGYNRDFQVPITILRPFNIYGIGQNPDFLIPSVIAQSKTGKITIKDERPKRDFIHVTDIISAIIKVIDKRNNNNNNNTLRTYNLGSGKSYSVKEIIEIVSQLSEHKIEYTCTQEIRPNEVLDTIADISKIKKELGWAPQVSLVEGLKSMFDLK